MSVTPLRPVHLDHLRMPSSDSAMGVGFRCVTPVRMNAVSGYPRATRSDSAFERVKHTLFFRARRAGLHGVSGGQAGHVGQRDDGGPRILGQCLEDLGVDGVDSAPGGHIANLQLPLCG